MIRFGSDGWTAPYGENFSETTVRCIAQAVGKWWAADYGIADHAASDRAAANHEASEVLVGYDTRKDARQMACAAAEVLAGLGFRVILSDRVCPITALSWTVASHERICGGFMITASHAPAHYLGVRIRRSDGSSVPYDEMRLIESLIDFTAPEQTGSYEQADIVTPYKAHIAACVDAEAIRAAQLTVVHDSLYGASRGIVRSILSEMGVSVHEIHAEDNPSFAGIHPHIHEPWVADCEQAVLECGASVGLINDGDGDRAGLVNDQGRFINPQMLSALLFQHLVKNRSMSGRVVVNLAGSVVTHKLARELDCELTVTPIGFSRASTEMREGDVLLSSDGLGGLALPCHVMERDGILVDLLMVEAMALCKQTPRQMLEGLEARFGHWVYGSRDVHLDSAAIQALRNMLPGICPAELTGKVPTAVNHMDGLRLEFDDGSWVLVRPSRAESLVRVYAEAPSADDCQTLLEDGAQIARGVLT